MIVRKMEALSPTAITQICQLSRARQRGSFHHDHKWPVSFVAPQFPSINRVGKLPQHSTETLYWFFSFYWYLTRWPFIKNWRTPPLMHKLGSCKTVLLINLDPEREIVVVGTPWLSFGQNKGEIFAIHNLQSQRGTQNRLQKDSKKGWVHKRIANGWQKDSRRTNSMIYPFDILLLSVCDPWKKDSS